ncbi:hypothetical protein Cri9333_4466 [Crinalium epipsammum PCC 9333]|uniref:Filamentous hemagglutinin outer membrane protein n=1 Tax=Crinalium epipsammum PCC 9333 TaxID=1173022 RepID=K9W4G3_9CYAN|nr:hypothetical protein [Crinalium epipsammum]AFZ15248.1 hypothetical protein Cri9333_4466 [Crinalium epipsammum PCC 9333]
MSIRNANQLKVLLGIITLTSVAALTPTAYAQVPARANDNILNRANLNTNTIKLDQQNLKLSPSVEQIPGLSKKADSDGNGICNGSCRPKAGRGAELLTNPALESNTKLIQSIRGINR